MALDLKVPSLFGNTGKTSTILRETYFKIGDALVIDVAGPPSDEHPEGTVVVNTIDNKLYVRIRGSSQQPVMHYKFNEAAGTDVSDSGSGGHNGVATSAEWVAGHYNNGFDFGGAEHITVASHADFDLTGVHTIEFWIYPKDTTESDCILSRGQVAVGGEDSYRISWLSGKLTYWRTDAGSGSGYRILADIPINAWSHVAFVSPGNDGGVGKVYTYLNGELDSEWDSVNLTVTVDGDATFIGSTQIGSSEPNAIIDDLKIWHELRTQDQIKRDSLKSAGLVWSSVTLTGA